MHVQTQYFARFPAREYVRFPDVKSRFYEGSGKQASLCIQERLLLCNLPSVIPQTLEMYCKRQKMQNEK